MSVDALSTTSISESEVSSLDHEFGDDTVEGGSLEVKRLSALSDSLFSSAESTEVLSRLGDYVVVKLKKSINEKIEKISHLDGNSSSLLVSDGHVKEDLRAVGCKPDIGGELPSSSEESHLKGN